MRTKLSILLLVLGACDRDDEPANRAPTIDLTSHRNGERIQEGYEIRFEATVTDGNDALTDLAVSWSVGDQELCPTAAPDGDGLSICDAVLQLGDTEIEALVTDPSGAMAWETLTIEVIETATPTANIVTPDGTATYYSNFEVALSGLVSDGEDAPEELTAWWESNIDGILDTDNTINEKGELTGSVLLSAGEQTLTLWVEDLSGKTGSDSITLDVPGDATEPSCEITSPEDESAVGYSEALTLRGKIDDADIAIEDLTVDFVSDLNGDLGTVSVNINTGDVTLDEDELILGDHEISLVVTDEMGLSCTDTVQLFVGHLPEITFTTPTDDAVINEGEPVALEVEVSDEDSELSELSVTFVSDIDGELGTVTPQEDGTASLDLESLSVGNQDITATITDIHGLTSTDVLQFVINGLPEAPSIELGPDPATTTDDLVVTIGTDSEDVEEDEITYTYAWALDGKTSTASTSETLSSEHTAKNQTWTVTVTPSDPYGTGTAATASLTVSNSPPTLTSTDVSLDPDEVYTDEDLTCTYAEGIDADDDTVNYTVTWLVDGVAVTGETSATLSGDHFSKGDSITCTVTVSDDEEDGESATSNVATVENSEPVISDLEITPSEAYAEDVLSCTWGNFDDPDGDPDETTIEWMVERDDFGSDPTLEGVFVADDDVKCTARAHDGEEEGNKLEVTITILNTIPTIDTVTISPDPATIYDGLSCAWSGFTDPDDHDDESTLVWTINGEEVGDDLTLTSGYVKGDEVACTVTPYDGEEEGEPLSASVVIGNTAPEMTSVTLSPAEPQTNDTVAVTMEGWDMDEDTLTYDVTWYVNGAPISASGNELDGSLWFDKDDEIVASVVPYDGDTYGDAMESDGLTILNTAPQAPEVLVSPALAMEGEDLVCSVVTESEDVDGDSITYSFSWTQDGLPYGGATTTSETGDTVPGTDTSAGELWMCTVTPHDGDDEGAEGAAQRAIEMGCRDLGGGGSEGDLTITSGTSEILTLDSTTLVTDATAGDVSLAVLDPVAFSNGDEVLILTMTGEASDCDSSAAGTWELGYVYDTTTSTIELFESISYNYDSSTATTQIIRIPHYDTVDMGSDSELSASPWDGDTGGVLVFRAKTLNLAEGAVIHMDAAGYLGGTSDGDGAQGPLGEEFLSGGAGGDGGEGCSGCTGSAGSDGTDGGGGGGSAGGVSTQATGGTCGGGGGAGAGQGGPSGGGQGAGKGGEGASGGGAVRSAGGGGGACAYEVPEVCTDWDMERLLMGAGGSAGASGGCAADSLDQGSGGSADGSSDCSTEGADGQAGGGIVMVMADEITGAASATIRANGGAGGDGGDGQSGGTVGSTIPVGNAGGGAGSGGMGSAGGTVLITADTWGTDADLIESDAAGGAGGAGGTGGDGSCGFGSTDVASGGDAGGGPGGDGTTAAGTNCSGAGGGATDGDTGDFGIVFVPNESTSSATFLYIADPDEARRLWGGEECTTW